MRKPALPVLAASLLSSFLSATQASDHPAQNCAPPPVEPVSSGLSADFSLSAESRHVTEGRDNLGGDPLLSAALEAGWRGFTAGVWRGAGPESNYDEVNFYGGFSREFGPVTASLSFARLEFLTDGAVDHEINLAADLAGLPSGLSVSMSAVCSLEARGVFIELACRRDVELGDRLVISPFVTAGWNEGYIPDGHRGPNHAALGLAAAVPICKNCEVSLHGTWSFALNADSAEHPGDGPLEDFFHCGATFRLSY